MLSPPLDNKHSRKTSGVALHNRPWIARTIGRRQALHAITAFGQHTRLNDVGRGMTSPPLDGTHGRMTLGGSCHHRIWEAHTVERRWAWHDINAFNQHLWSNDIGRDIPSPPLDNTLSKMTSGVAYHHRRWIAHTVGNVGRGMLSPPLDNTHG